MATMDWDDLFTQYYTLFRAESSIPSSSDDEYTIATRLAKEAINRWANYNGTYWKELFTNLLSSAQVSPVLVTTLTTSTKTYTAPTDMREAGGYVRVVDSSNNTIQRYPIIEPQDAQFRNGSSTYCYFSGNPQAGFVLHLNPAPDTSLNGKSFDYIYYKKPTFITTGTDKPEMADPYFIVHEILANRFRSTRNPYYTSAQRDAKDSIETMKMDNDSGNWADPWKLADNSGTVFGSE